MKIVVSPAKSLDFESQIPTNEYTLPRFLTETDKLNAALKKKSRKKLSDLMSISAALAELNYDRNQTRGIDYTLDNARQAVYAFNGDVYLGLDIHSLNPEKLPQLQEKLRILSGLYGLLKPLDLIQPYRLEMGTKLKVGRKNDLYAFWDKKVTESLNEELEAGEPFINLASNEYFKVVKPELLKSPVITPIFKDYVNGNLKVVSFHAKKARGMMTRFVLDKNIENAESLKTFNYGNYEFDEKQSNAQEWVFVR
ncbi:peroxide stress protein YaaA [Marinilongibacter aquaticus]|uniref:peroxide stress protein YaaA n=1 Tax=Marinilongibacter aquaticus TaxID=2975157 RepID=UPI0021BCFED1|nr:peroxide stress protein YaaA [Marinilongibacter aquaticus]UBM57230.1 peroxide stress protein YaaA [Marinilongibacter aquaticus]